MRGGVGRWNCDAQKNEISLKSDPLMQRSKPSVTENGWCLRLVVWQEEVVEIEARPGGSNRLQLGDGWFPLSRLQHIQ
jgi:hypothetical protein